MAITKHFDIPFAEGGDKTLIPDATQPSGDVSYNEGYGPDFEIDQVADPVNAKDIPREEMNQQFFDITQMLKVLQTTGIGEYDARFNYEVDAYVQGSDGRLYRATVANGPATTVEDPVGGVLSVWEMVEGDIGGYVATLNYLVGNIVKGSDDNIYRALANNGPGFGVNDPVVSPATWEILTADTPNYDATFNYQLNQYVKGSDSFLYVAIAPNGPATTVRDPVGGSTNVWHRISGGVAQYIATYDYVASDVVIGSDNLIYQATTPTGPDANLKDPVGGSDGTWIRLSGGIAVYDATFDYVSPDYVVASDSLLYRAIANNGPSSSVVDPVGNPATWLPATTTQVITTVFTSSGTFVPTSGVRSIKFTVTGSGGGGGGVFSGAGTSLGFGIAGSAGGTAIRTISVIDASYSITVGAGGAGGAPTSGNAAAGSTGGLSTVTASGLSPDIIANGGVGGTAVVFSDTTNIQRAGQVGGTASGGDANITGGGSGSGISFDETDDFENITTVSVPGVSFWGGGAEVQGPSGAGSDGEAPGSGGGAGVAHVDLIDSPGGDGADGFVFIEEYL